jgi:hypothetical protein
MKPFARPAHLPSFVQLGATVWYESLPGHIFAAVVIDEPRQLCDGEWVAKIKIVEGGRTNIVTVDALEPRRASRSTPLHEFIALFFGIEATNPEAA